ncbi:hypothetical protein SAMN04487948_1299 [Halogranum amylolyticum]|uniref:Uncharacterized protein n=1 Tax=Halogranum amylolyticum TaxID=660520 RepID=A0A1H8WFJ2_9EURY|nr:hypothetical protein [Halogranum amylolyticum]SEP26444.1 hypothetical protein SAMN04487948_1299 [Halogranum amylolyticum]
MTDYRTPGGHIDERTFVVRGTAPSANPSPRQWRWRKLDTGRERRASLSLVVRVVDAFTGRPPQWPLDVSVDGIDVTPVSGRRGHYLFLDVDLPSSPITVGVTGGPWYDDTSEQVEWVTTDSPTPPVINPRQRPVVLEMMPSTTYPFPAATTLVRGTVRDERGGADRAVPDAAVAVDGVDRRARTTDIGEFVLFFQPSPEGTVSVVREGGEWVTKVGNQDPTLVATDGSTTVESTVRVETGRTTRTVLTFVDPP